MLYDINTVTNPDRIFILNNSFLGLFQFHDRLKGPICVRAVRKWTMLVLWYGPRLVVGQSITSWTRDLTNSKQTSPTYHTAAFPYSQKSQIWFKRVHTFRVPVDQNFIIFYDWSFPQFLETLESSGNAWSWWWKNPMKCENRRNIFNRLNQMSWLSLWLWAFSEISST